MQETAVVLGVLAVFAALLSTADYKQVRTNVRARLTEMARPSAIQLIPVFLIGSLLVGSVWYYRHLTPPVDYVSGVYKSACCPDVKIRHGEVAIGDEHAHLKLQYLKYGLSGRLDKPIGPLFAMEDGKKIPVELLFQENQQFTVADYHFKGVVYRREHVSHAS